MIVHPVAVGVVVDVTGIVFVAAAHHNYYFRWRFRDAALWTWVALHLTKNAAYFVLINIDF